MAVKWTLPASIEPDADPAPALIGRRDLTTTTRSRVGGDAAARMLRADAAHPSSWTPSMSAGLAALLDDVAAIARAAAASIDDVAAGAGKAGAKAAGVVVDDTAVTPRYVDGFTPERELPVIARIARGSLRNKLLFILPAALALSELLPWLLTPLLMAGGTYLCFEGAEKLWEAINPAHGPAEVPPAAAEPGTTEIAGIGVQQSAAEEERMVKGAIRTDFILSAEIMVIALDEVADEPLLSRAIILAVVGVLITALVYGAVSLIVKMDDVGLRLAQSARSGIAKLGRGMVRAMPIVMRTLSTVGIAAMLWVGGHILLVGLDELGVHWLYDQVHHLEERIQELDNFAEWTVDVGAPIVGELFTLSVPLGLFAWLANTVASAILGTIVGAAVVALLHLRGGHGEPTTH